MNVKAAVELGKRYIVDIYAGEEINNIGLEEVEFDEGEKVWYVTVGFSRPWDEPKNIYSELSGKGTLTKRSFKKLRISDENGTVLSVKNRDIPS